MFSRSEFRNVFAIRFVYIATFGWNTYFDSMLGSFGAWAHVPHELLVFPDAMNFWQRLQNVYYCLMDKYARHFVYMPQQQALADKYFAHLPGKSRVEESYFWGKHSINYTVDTGPHPSLEELGQSVSVILQNSYAPMTSVKPNVPGVVDVGGLHIKAPQRLPADVKKFLDEAKDGVIYFSFGTMNHLDSYNITNIHLCIYRYSRHRKRYAGSAVGSIPTSVQRVQHGEGVVEMGIRAIGPNANKRVGQKMAAPKRYLGASQRQAVHNARWLVGQPRGNTSWRPYVGHSLLCWPAHQHEQSHIAEIRSEARI